MAEHIPREINLNQKTRILELTYENGKHFKLSCEYLRTHSPSAEVQGHGPGQEVLQVGKEDVNINAINPVGNYAVQLVFDDNHDSGIFSWDYLYELGSEQEEKWQRYLERLKEAGHERKNV